MQSISMRFLLEPIGLNWFNKILDEQVAEGSWPGSEDWLEQHASQHNGKCPDQGCQGLIAMVGYQSGERYQHESRSQNGTRDQKRKSLESWALYGNQGCQEKPQDLGVSCVDDLSRGEGRFNEMVAEGVLSNSPDLKRALP